jgi:hypothetical protein
MRRPVRGALTALAVALVCAAAAVPVAASSYRRCGTSRFGFITTDGAWEVSGPFLSALSYGTAVSIARRVAPEEFGYRATTRDVYCNVAESVDWVAANAWVGVGWRGYSRGPYFGAFHCTGTGRADGGAVETCRHSADRHAGRIVVQLTVTPAPSTR